MQFPVPQFTDVEDKIIGSLTIKQFGILFGAGVVIFLAYSATKSILVLIFFFVLFGMPALTLAFAKINGRPVYNTIGYFVKFWSSPRVLIFHKEVSGIKNLKQVKDAQLAKEPQTQNEASQDPQVNLKTVQALLNKTEIEEKDIVSKIH